MVRFFSWTSFWIFFGVAVLVESALPIHGQESLVWAFVIWAFFLGYFTIWIMRWFKRPKSFPAGSCPVCGYNLTANTTGICPECGSVIVLPTTAPEPKSHPPA
jgi:hypothetical protein